MKKMIKTVAFALCLGVGMSGMVVTDVEAGIISKGKEKTKAAAKAAGSVVAKGAKIAGSYTYKGGMAVFNEGKKLAGSSVKVAKGLISAFIAEGKAGAGKDIMAAFNAAPGSKAKAVSTNKIPYEILGIATGGVACKSKGVLLFADNFLDPADTVACRKNIKDAAAFKKESDAAKVAIGVAVTANDPVKLEKVVLKLLKK